MEETGDINLQILSRHPDSMPAKTILKEISSVEDNNILKNIFHVNKQEKNRPYKPGKLPNELVVFTKECKRE